MMKTVFLLLCVLTAVADDFSLTYETIDISGFSKSGEEQAQSSSFLEESKLKKPQQAKAVETVTEIEEHNNVDFNKLSETITESPIREQTQVVEESYVQPKPRLSRLDKQRRYRRKLQKYNNLLLQERIEKQRLNVESELGKKVQKLQLSL